MMPDKYDEQIARLLASHDVSKTAWDDWVLSVGLFAYAHRRNTLDDLTRGAGCLTMIRRHPHFRAETPELTDAIRADERLPDDIRSITKENAAEILGAFAEWQRRLDKELQCN